MVELTEDKGIGQDPRPIENGRAAGFLESGSGISDRADIAVGHHRYPIDGLDHGANACAAHGTFEALLTGAAVNDHTGDAGLLEGTRRSGAVSDSSSQPSRILTVTGIDTESTTPSQVDRPVHLAQEGRSAAGLDDLPHRTAHVDVDRRGPFS